MIIVNVDEGDEQVAGFHLSWN